MTLAQITCVHLFIGVITSIRLIECLFRSHIFESFLVFDFGVFLECILYQSLFHFYLTLPYLNLPSFLLLVFLDVIYISLSKILIFGTNILTLLLENRFVIAFNWLIIGIFLIFIILILFCYSASKVRGHSLEHFNIFYIL